MPKVSGPTVGLTAQAPLRHITVRLMGVQTTNLSSMTAC